MLLLQRVPNMPSDARRLSRFPAERRVFALAKAATARRCHLGSDTELAAAAWTFDEVTQNCMHAQYL